MPIVEKRDPLMDSAVALAAITAFLYCVGTAYYGGYLSVLRLDTDVLDRNFNQTLYQGFLIIFAPAFVAIVVYAFYRLIEAYLVRPEINKWLLTSSKNKRSFLKIRPGFLRKRRGAMLDRPAKKHALAVLIIAAISVAFFLMLFHFETQGKKAALKILKKIDTKSVQPTDLMLLVRIDGQDRRLLDLGCGARNCAGIDLVTRTVIYFPQNGHSYILPPRAPTAPNKNQP